MKKFIFSILLLTICVLPAFAKMNMDLIVKGGILASPYIDLDKNVVFTEIGMVNGEEQERTIINSRILDVDLGFTLGGEVFAYPW